MRVRFASWNVGCPSPERLKRQLERLAELECDVVALQEVSLQNCVLARESRVFATVLGGSDLRPVLPDEGRSRDRGCAILLGAAAKQVAPAGILDGSAAPERSLYVPIELSGEALWIASFHQVAGSDRKKWGPAKKAQTFRAIVEWMGRHGERSIVGMDLNSPMIDHPELARNVYFHDRRPGDQEEHLLHDPTSARHTLVDAYRALLRDRPDELERIRRERPAGPLQISHVVRGQPRRFDFVYVSPDIRVVDVRYDGSVMERGLESRLADHALVVADLDV